jgi:Fungal protein kinase
MHILRLIEEKSSQCTAPFIAMELLMFGVPHRVVHDLESVFFVLLFICTHLDGPYNTICDPPLYGPKGKGHPSPMKHWLNVNTFSVVGHLKYSHMSCHSEEVILPHISPFFEPLKPHLKAFWHVLHPQRTTILPVGTSGSHSQATAGSIVDVFKQALQDKQLINEAEKSPITLGKHSLPGNLVSTGWDAV